MDRYQKVEKPKVDTPIDANEIRITSQGRMRSYITYAMTLLQEKESDEIVFKAMGRAINKTVTIVELIKRRIVGLHQITAIQSTDITDTWEPLEEGLQILETTRKVSMVTITLSKKELDQKNIGYQPPIPADQVKVPAEVDYDGEGSPPARGRGRGRGGRGRGRPRGRPGNGYAPAEYDEGGYEQDRGYTRGRGRGRGRGIRGRGRGGYDGPQVDNRGRGRGGYDGPQMDNQYDEGDYVGNGYAPAEYDEGGYEQDRGYTRGRGRGIRGRGRGGYDGPQMDNRGRVRGGYDGPQMDNQYDAGGYNQEAPPRGRGRGRGNRGRGRGFRSNGPPIHVAA